MTAESDPFEVYRRIHRLGPPDSPASDPFEMFRSGRLGQVPAFASPADPQRLLSSVADALNACERHGLVVDLEKDGVITTRGYVLPVGDSRLGSRWAARMRKPADYIPEDEGRDED